MGRRDKSYSKDLHQQAYDKLTSMQHFGESKKEAKADGTEKDKIFSFSTYQTYWKHTKYFIKWVQDKYPECTTLKSAKKHVNEWLQERVDTVDKNGNPLSAWTISTETAALCKLYGIAADDPERFQPPKRKREDIKRSRVDVVRDKHFSKTNNDEFIKFCKGTGLRREGIRNLKGDALMSVDQMKVELKTLENKKELTSKEQGRLNILKDALLFKDTEYYIFTREKGGRERISPIVGANADQIIERMKNTKAGDKVWQRVPVNADIHGYRGDYATSIYRKYARNIEDIPYDRTNKGTGKKYQSEVYVCRKDEVGKKCDKQAMFLCSKALGHNRIEVVANNYIRGL